MMSFIVDTNVWVAYFEKNEACREIIDENLLKTPSLVFAELSRVFARRKLNEKETQEFLDFVEQKSIVLDLDLSHAIRGGALSERERLPFADALIYAYASDEEPLVTNDSHFKGKPFVKFVER
ncbi:PIN domain-containing protein [Candidatus Micrarchaeota archaeon]|nr:PIN domain-containing protein [Candidatus Micrarchaeota archaeon]